MAERKRRRASPTAARAERGGVARTGGAGGGAPPGRTCGRGIGRVRTGIDRGEEGEALFARN